MDKISKIRENAKVRSLFTGLNRFQLALVQLAVGRDKAANLQRAAGMVREAAKKGAQVIVLPVSDWHTSNQLYVLSHRKLVKPPLA